MTPHAQARTAGLLALLTTPAGFAAAALGSLVMPDDSAATAHNIMNHEFVYRLAVAGDVISVLYIPYTLLLYRLFRPAGKDLSLLAALFSIVGTAIGITNVIFELAPLVVFGGAQALSAFGVDQVQALASMFLQLHSLVTDLSLVLFGAYNMLIGYLIVRSGLLPRILGLLLALAGLCYEINSFATFLAPDFAAHLVPYILVPGLSEIAVALWLLLFGVNERRWRAVAGLSPA